MKSGVSILTSVLLAGSCAVASAEITPEQARALPSPANHSIDFSKEIKPLFEASCIKCHGRGKAKGGFSLENREMFLKGGDSGPAAVPGKSAESHLIALVAGLEPDNIMPQKGSRLNPQQIGALRAWIDQGLPWDQTVSFGKPAPINLTPARPALPPARSKDTHPIDRLLDGYFRAHNLKPSKPVDDRAYARRVYLDVIGLLPSPEELGPFLSDRRADKRERLVQRLLADNQRYAGHWLTFWNDALRNDYKGTGYIDGGRKQITTWLFAALARNLPYDQFVAQLISPVPESEGFSKGIVWRGVVNASQTPQMQAAQNISQVFMGVNLKCASCHDSFINDWSLADAYGLANIYADEPLEMYKCDKPTGQKAPTRFIYPELGAIDPKSTRQERLKRLAEILTSKQNGRLPRTIVNRLWARFMGRGLVEPVDDMEQPAWHADLLDWLAADLVEHGYDLKRTIEVILTSQAYQLPAISADERIQKDYVFRGPSVRRMSAEQLLDALSELTGIWKSLPANTEIDFTACAPPNREKEATMLNAPATAKWVWTDRTAAQTADPLTLYLRKTVSLPDLPTEAFVFAACDNSFKLYINGKEATSGNDWKKPKLVDIRSHLVKGENLFAVSAVNDPAPPDETKTKADDKANDKLLSASKANPAGLLLYARIRFTERKQNIPIEKVWDFGTDSSWLWSTARFANWERPDLVPYGWINAVELGPVATQPWNLETQFRAALSVAAHYNQIRASLVNSDPLMTALGRPNREQVITTRPGAATTLQALELTNGSTLAGLLRRGAEKLAAEAPNLDRDLVVDLYEKGLGRKPTASELALAKEMMGRPVRKEGVEDLLWVMAMLPEFQLIY